MLRAVALPCLRGLWAPLLLDGAGLMLSAVPLDCLCGITCAAGASGIARALQRLRMLSPIRGKAGPAKALEVPEMGVGT